MTSFRLVDASAKQVWSDDYMREYVRDSGFLPYMGSKDTNIIRTDMNLTKENGEVVHFPYFRALNGAGLTGSTTSYGNEDTLFNYSKGIKATYRRNVVMVPENEAFRTELDVANVARGRLKDWSSSKIRDDLIVAGNSIVIPGGVDADGLPAEDSTKTYDAASATDRNTHLANNSDRVLFGHALGNNTGTFSTSLSNVNATDDQMSAKLVRLAKRIAQKTQAFKITPIRTDASAGREWFVLFVGLEGFTSLSNDPEIQQMNREARPRDVENNPLFQGGDLILDGVIIRCEQSMPAIVGVGANGVNVGQAWLCGSNALGVVWSMKPEPRTEVRDGGLENRQYIVEIRGQDKMSFGGVQSGMVSIFYAAIEDA